MTDQGEKHEDGLDEAWRIKAQKTTLDISKNGSSERSVDASLPWIELPCFPGPDSTVNLAFIADRWFLILCVYSRLEMVRARRWNAHAEKLAQEGYRIIALSAETPKTQKKRVLRAKLSYSVVSDSELQLERPLGLPVVESDEGARVYEDLTLLAHGPRAKVFYPIEHSPDDVAKVMSEIRRVHADR